MNRILIAVAAFVVWTGLAFAAGWMWRGDRADLTTVKRDKADVTAVVEAVQDARQTEHTQAEKMAEIGDKHEEDRRDAASVPDAVVAALRDGNLRLQRQWAACETSRLSGSAAAALEFDALSELRRKDQGDLVRVGRECNAHVGGLQAVISADRIPQGEQQ